MDYGSAENQIAKVEQQAQPLLQSIQALAQKLRTGAPDEATGREWAMDLREIALTMQTQNQALQAKCFLVMDYILGSWYTFTYMILHHKTYCHYYPYFTSMVIFSIIHLTP